MTTHTDYAWQAAEAIFELPICGNSSHDDPGAPKWYCRECTQDNTAAKGLLASLIRTKALIPEVEAAVKEACGFCAEGVPVTNGSYHGMGAQMFVCGATALRARLARLRSMDDAQ